MSDFLNRALGRALLSRGMGATDVILIRHGQQERPGADAPESDAFDPPLSELGRAQAQAAAEALAGEPLQAVFASDLRRASETGEAIAARHGLGVEADERLREVGIFERVLPGASIMDTVGQTAAQAAAADLVRTRKWDAVPLSESSDAFRRRAHAAIWDIVRTFARDQPPVAEGEPGPTIAIACHGGIINAFLAQEYGIAIDFLFRPVHAGLTRVRFDLQGPLDTEAGRAMMVTGNEHAHLVPGGLVTY